MVDRLTKSSPARTLKDVQTTKQERKVGCVLQSILPVLTVSSIMRSTSVTSGVELPKKPPLVCLDKTTFDLSIQHPAIFTPFEHGLPAWSRFRNAAHAQSTTTLKGTVVDFAKL